MFMEKSYIVYGKHLGISIDKVNFLSQIAIVRNIPEINGLLFKAQYCFSRNILLRFYQTGETSDILTDCFCMEVLDNQCYIKSF